MKKNVKGLERVVRIAAGALGERSPGPAIFKGPGAEAAENGPRDSVCQHSQAQETCPLLKRRGYRSFFCGA